MLEAVSDAIGEADALPTSNKPHAIAAAPTYASVCFREIATTRDSLFEMFLGPFENRPPIAEGFKQLHRRVNTNTLLGKHSNTRPPQKTHICPPQPPPNHRHTPWPYHRQTDTSTSKLEYASGLRRSSKSSSVIVPNDGRVFTTDSPRSSTPPSTAVSSTSSTTKIGAAMSRGWPAS